MSEDAVAGLMRELVEIARCWWCGHAPRGHAGYTGPCGDCWAEGRMTSKRQRCGVTLCERFIPDAGTLSRLEEARAA